MSQSDDVPLQVKGKGRSNQSSVSDGKSEQSNQELLVEEIPPPYSGSTPRPEEFSPGASPSN
jgi:hypothetical protein